MIKFDSKKAKLYKDLTVGLILKMQNRESKVVVWKVIMYLAVKRFGSEIGGKRADLNKRDTLKSNEKVICGSTKEVWRLKTEK
jgi:hypothetical protein